MYFVENLQCTTKISVGISYFRTKVSACSAKFINYINCRYYSNKKVCGLRYKLLTAPYFALPSTSRTTHYTFFLISVLLRFIMTMKATRLKSMVDSSRSSSCSSRFFSLSHRPLYTKIIISIIIIHNLN
jgi:hypothetical protein